MRKLVFVALGAVLLSAGAWSSPATAGEIFSTEVRGNRANQVIAGFPASTVDWSITRGQVTLISLSSDHTLLLLRVKGLIIPALGFNPSPDVLARVICHDGSGSPFEAARTAPAPFTRSGDVLLVARVVIPDPCFAPIVLVTGSTDPAGNRPGNWFGVSGL